MESSNTSSNIQTKKNIYPGEGLGPLLKFLGWFIFIGCLITGIAISASDKSSSSSVVAIIIITSSIPTGLIFGALGCVLENLVQLRKRDDTIHV